MTSKGIAGLSKGQAMTLAFHKVFAIKLLVTHCIDPFPDAMEHSMWHGEGEL
jgi:hypothetical protein